MDESADDQANRAMRGPADAAEQTYKPADGEARAGGGAGPVGIPALQSDLPAAPPEESAAAAVEPATTARSGRSSSPPPGAFRLVVTLPNGAVGKPYDADARVGLRLAAKMGLREDACRLALRSVDGLADTGLRADVDGNYLRIYGNATKPGDHKVRIFFTVRCPSIPEISDSDEIALTINPDPRSLWKDLEPDPALPCPKPHTALERLETPDAALVAASRRGRSHAHEGSFRDDDFALGYDAATGWHFLVVADGAGSAKLSRRGSQVACAAVPAVLQQHFSTTLGGEFDKLVPAHAAGDPAARQAIIKALYSSLGAAALAARKAVEREADARSATMRDMATTFLMAVCRKYQAGWFVGSFSIGDGGIGCYSRGRGAVPLSRADGGDFAGQTRFLTMAEVWQDSQDIVKRIECHVEPELSAVFAMTDGVTDPKFETDAKFTDTARWHDFWDDLGKGVGMDARNKLAAEQLLEWLSFWSTGNHDDRTLAMLIPT